MEISHHVSSRAVFDAHFIVGDSIGNKVVSDVDMPGTLAAGPPAVVFEFDGTLIVLVTYNICCPQLVLVGFPRSIGLKSFGEGHRPLLPIIVWSWRAGKQWSCNMR